MWSRREVWFSLTVICRGKKEAAENSSHEKRYEVVEWEQLLCLLTVLYSFVLITEIFYGLRSTWKTRYESYDRMETTSFECPGNRRFAFKKL